MTLHRGVRLGRAAAPKSANSPVLANLGSSRFHHSNQSLTFLLILSTAHHLSLSSPPSFLSIVIGPCPDSSTPRRRHSKSSCQAAFPFILHIAQRWLIGRPLFQLVIKLLAFILSNCLANTTQGHSSHQRGSQQFYCRAS